MQEQGQQTEGMEGAGAGACDVFGDAIPSTGNDIRDRRIAVFLQAMAQTKGVVTTSCLVSGISSASVYEWRKKYSWFNEKIEYFQTEFRGDFLENQLLTLCQLGAERSIHFALQNKRFSKLGYTEIQHTREADALTDTQAAMLKRFGIDVALDAADTGNTEGHTGHPALPAPQQPDDVHGTGVYRA